MNPARSVRHFFAVSALVAIGLAPSYFVEPQLAPQEPAEG
jgi:hypothetical protein